MNIINNSRMKIESKIYRAFLCTMTVIVVSSTGMKAQDISRDKGSVVKDLISSKHFVFNAESVLPSNGRLRILNSGEQMDLNGDTLTTDLPYFGRAYTAPIDPSEGGFHFTSTEFDYNVKEKKRGGWDVSIKPRDNSDVRQLALNVSPGGSAILQVTSNNRQFISFNGHINQRKAK